MNGVIYVAYGRAARCEVAMGLPLLLQHNDLPVAVICAKPIDKPMEVKRLTSLIFDEPGWGARWAKLNIDKLAPRGWNAFLYLDADTRVYGSLQVGFDILADGWDMVIVPSSQQADRLLWHVTEIECEESLDELGNPFPLQLQGGVFWIARNKGTAKLFDAWREEWRRWEGPDQAALLRALHRSPVKVWLMGGTFNSGAVVGHRFGMARER